MKNIIMVSTAVVSVASIGYAIYTGRKMDKLYTLTVDSLAGKVDVKISDELIHDAVQVAVNREATNRVRTEANSATAAIKAKIYSEIKTSVDASFSDIKTSVTSEAARQVSNIDILALKKEVREKAKEEVLKKFNNELDTLLNDFNQNLTNVSKIYSSIAENMTKNKETVIKLG